jgi:shikimate 5-dehydrogenase
MEGNPHLEVATMMTEGVMFGHSTDWPGLVTTINTLIMMSHGNTSVNMESSYF